MTQFIIKHKTAVTCAFLRIAVFGQLLIAQASVGIEDLTDEQALFIQRVGRSNREAIQTFAQLDSTVRHVQLAWKAHAEASSHGLTDIRFDLYLLLRGATNRLSMKDVDEYLDVHFALPAFVDQFPYYTENPNPAKAIVIRQARNLFLKSYLLELPRKLREQLFITFQSAESAADKYLQLDDLNPRIRSELEYLKWDLPGQGALWTIITLIEEDRLNDAEELVRETIRSNGNFAQWIAHQGLMIVRQYRSQGKTAEALSLLDDLVGMTTDEMLSLAFVGPLYESLDKAGYEERMKYAKNRRIGGAASVRSSPTASLEGSYSELASGQRVTLEDYRGKFVILDFWATWCAPCRVEIPTLNQFADELKTRDDVVFLSVCGDPMTSKGSPQRVKKFITLFRINYPVLWDDPDKSLTLRFGISRWPTKVLVGKDGTASILPSDPDPLSEIRRLIQNR